MLFFSSVLKSGDLKKIADVVVNALCYVNPTYATAKSLVKPLIESYTNTIKEDSKKGAGGVYSGTKLVTRLLLDFASFGGLVSGVAKVGKTTAQLSVDAAEKIAIKLKGSLAKAAVEDTTYRAMYKISEKCIDLDAGVKQSSRVAINKTAEVLTKFMSRLKIDPYGIFDMIKKTSYSDKTKVLNVTTVDNNKLLFNKENLIKDLSSKYSKEESEDIFKMLYTGCFTAETLIHTKRGLVEIQYVSLGDEVLSKNIETGEISYKKVVKVYEKSTEKIVRLEIGNEIVETTENHLFFTDCGWWKKAESIEIGEKILGKDGTYESVKTIERKHSDKPIAIFDLNIDENHTYFVGLVGALVHNNCIEEEVLEFRKITSVLKNVNLRTLNSTELIDIVKKSPEIGRSLIAKISKEFGTSIKSNPLRQAYENEVTNLSKIAKTLAVQGKSDEEIARQLSQMRRDLGVKYKDLSPQLLKEHIYDVNLERYKDPLGPTIEYLRNKGKSWDEIIVGSCKPNSDVDKLLGDFEEWMIKKCGL
jgi:hypothetical protein